MASTPRHGIDPQGNPVLWNGASWVPDPVKNKDAPGASLWYAPPSATVDPKALARQYAKDEEYLTAERTALKNNRKLGETMNEFEKANQNIATGGILSQHGPEDKPAWGIDVIGGIKGLALDVNPDYQAANAASSILQVATPKTGQGVITEGERKLFRYGVPSTDKMGGVNQNIINHMRAAQAEHSDYLDFAEKYRSANGTIAGADVAWDKYLQKNPYTTTVEVTEQDIKKYGYPKSGKLIAKRPAGVMPWTQYFGLEPAPRASAPRTAAPQAGAPKATGSFRYLGVEEK